jgi:hypothetical protein
MAPQWIDGRADNLEAAAQDADAWLEIMERFVQSGVWHFSRDDSMGKLQGCRAALQKHLEAAAKDAA